MDDDDKKQVDSQQDIFLQLEEGSRVILDIEKSIRFNNRTIELEAVKFQHQINEEKWKQDQDSDCEDDQSSENKQFEKNIFYDNQKLRNHSSHDRNNYLQNGNQNNSLNDDRNKGLKPGSSSKQDSSDFQQYMEYFAGMTTLLVSQGAIQQQSSYRKQLLQQLDEHGIVYNQDKNYVKSSSAVLSKMTDRESRVKDYEFEILSMDNAELEEVFEIKVRLGQFYLTILVLEQLEELDKVQNGIKQAEHLIAVGAFGKIYLYHSFLAQNQSKSIANNQSNQTKTETQFQKNTNKTKNQRQYIVKSLPIKNENEFVEIFVSALKQYSFSLIMSALKIGPRVLKKWGYDIILSRNKLSFLMEVCGKFQPHHNQFQRLELDLKQCLSTMHSFRIIHHDIKPQNIAYSPHFEKWIFIDFGLSTIIEQEIGQKSLVKFLGTYQYTTADMRKTFFKKGWVDLYFNDVFGLRESLKALKFMEKGKQVAWMQEDPQAAFHGHDLSMRCDQSLEWKVIQEGSLMQEAYFDSKNMEHNIGSFYNIQINDNIAQKTGSHLKTLPQKNHQINYKHVNVYELLYQFKHCIYTKQKSLLDQIFSHLQSYYSYFNEEKEQQRELVQEMIAFLEKAPLTGFIKEIYQIMTYRTVESFQMMQKIEKKLYQSSFTPFMIQNPLFGQEESIGKRSRLTIIRENYLNAAEINIGSGTSINLPHMYNLPEFHQYKNGNEVKNILLKKYQLLKKEQYYELYFNYITFRQRLFNCGFEEKVEVAEVFSSIMEEHGHKRRHHGKRKDEKVSKGRRIILESIEYLIGYCSEQPVSVFKQKYFTELVSEYVFINPYILDEESLEINYELEFIKVALKLSSTLSSFLIACYKIIESFRFLFYKNQHLFTSYYERENYFGRFVLMYLKGKNLLLRADTYEDMIQADEERQVHLEIKSQVAVQSLFDIEEGLKLFRLLEQLAHSNWVEENNFYKKDYKYFKKKYLQFKSKSQSILSLSHRDRLYLQQSLKTKYIKLALTSETLPLEEQQEILLAYKKFQQEKKVRIKLMEITEKLCEEKDLRSMSTLVQKIDFLINCDEISSEYLGNYRAYADCLAGRLQTCLAIETNLIHGLKDHIYGEDYFCTVLRFFKPLRSWKYKIPSSQRILQQLIYLQNMLMIKVLNNMKLFLAMILTPGLYQLDLNRISQEKCKKCFIQIFNHLNLNLRFYQKQLQQELYSLYFKYFNKFSLEMIQLKYIRLIKILKVEDAEEVRKFEERELELRMAHYDYCIKLQKFQYNEFLEKFEEYRTKFQGEYFYMFEFLVNYMKVISIKGLNIMNTIYRNQPEDLLSALSQEDKVYYLSSQSRIDLTLKQSAYAIEKLTWYFKDQINFQRFAFQLEIFNLIIIHLWYNDREQFFQRMIERQSQYIMTDQTVHFGRTYYYIIDLIGSILIVCEFQRKDFVQEFVKYAEVNIDIKLNMVRKGRQANALIKGNSNINDQCKIKLSNSFIFGYSMQNAKQGKKRDTVFYEVFAILHIANFFCNPELFQHLKFISKLLKLSILCLPGLTYFARPLCRSFIYVVYFNLLYEVEMIRKLQQLEPVLFGSKANILFKGYLRYVLKKLIKQDSLKMGFFDQICREMVERFLVLRVQKEDSQEEKRQKRLVNQKIVKILENMK